jgi:hypothetical protein
MQTAGFNTIWNTYYTFLMLIGNESSFTKIPRSLHNWSCPDMVKTNNQKLWLNASNPKAHNGCGLQQ